MQTTKPPTNEFVQTYRRVLSDKEAINAISAPVVSYLKNLEAGRLVSARRRVPSSPVPWPCVPASWKKLLGPTRRNKTRVWFPLSLGSHQPGICLRATGLDQ